MSSVFSSGSSDICLDITDITTRNRC